MSKNFSGDISAVGGAVVADVNDMGNLTLVIKTPSTFAGANLIFEASIDSTDGVTDGTWVNINASRSNANTSELSSGVLGAAPAYSWEISCFGYKFFRVRATALTSGVVPIQIFAQRDSVENSPVIQTHSVTIGATTGASALSVESAASTNLAVVKSSAGTLFEISASNPTATPAFLKVYNKATTPTLASDTPVMTIPVPANSVVSLSFGMIGKRLTAGFSIAITGLIGKTDSIAAVAGVQVHGTFI